MILVSPSSYRAMPWANGKGVTTEILREDGPAGLLIRLSMAIVVENGPFSAFPGIDRILTVIDGPGFGLIGAGLDLRAEPLVPVAFPGDVEISATGVTGRAVDFNVMTARGIGAACVVPLAPGGTARIAAARLAVFAVGDTTVDIEGRRRALRRHATLIAADAAEVVNRGRGHVLAVGLPA